MRKQPIKRIKEDADVVNDDAGVVEVEKILDPAELPIQHADEPIEMLDVFEVENTELSPDRFIAVVDIADNDADTGITLLQLTESGEVDEDATLNLVQNVVDKLEDAGHEVVNVNAVGIDAAGTVGDEEVAAEMIGEDEEDNLNEPVEGGFEVVGNADGSFTLLGEPEVLLQVTFADAVDDVKGELSELPDVSDELVVAMESMKSLAFGGKRKLVEASEDEYAAAIADYTGDDVEDLSVRMDNAYGVEYAEVDAGNAEYMVFDSYDDAKEFAEGRVEDDLDNEPEMFSPDFISNHLYISDTDKRIMAGEYADSRVGDMSDDEVVSEAGMESEYEEANDNDDYDAAEQIVQDARDELIDRYSDEAFDEYDDIIGYFGNQLGYDMKDIINLSFVQIDTREAAQDAVDTDGVAHFLSMYNGEQIDLDNGMVAFRTN